MKCKYCNNEAEKINIIEHRKGAETIVTRTYVCRLHAGGNSGDTSTQDKKRLQEYGLMNPTGDDYSS